MSITKIETASGVTLVLNGNTIFASDDTSYWLQESKIIGGNGHVSSSGVGWESSTSNTKGRPFSEPAF